jgi:hypothetical protein
MVALRRPKNWPALPQKPPKPESKPDPHSGSRARIEPAAIRPDTRERRQPSAPVPDWVRSTDRVQGWDVTEGRDHTKGIDRTRGRDRTGRF